MTSTPSHRVAFYARVSTSDQDASMQLRELREVASRSGWIIAAEHVDQGISGSKGREARPALDAVMKSVARKEVDLVACWAVDRIARSLPHLVAFMGELEAKGCGLYLHRSAVDTTTPHGRAMVGLLGVFAELERSLICERVKSGMARARAAGKRFGRPAVDDTRLAKVRALLASGVGKRKTARIAGVGVSVVMRASRAVAAAG